MKALDSVRVQAAQAAAQFWLLLVETAEEIDAGGSVEFIARDSGWSLDSIKKRVNAAAYFLNRGTRKEFLLEWGPERTVSLWQKECNLNQGKQKGETENLTYRLRREDKQTFQEMVKRVKTLTGASSETVLQFIAEKFLTAQDSEVLMLWKGWKGE